MAKIMSLNTFDFSEPFLVLAFDPGGTTGWASALYKNEGTFQDDITLDDIIIQTGEFTGDHHKELFDFITNGAIYAEERNMKLYVVRENFEFRQFARAEGDPAGRSKLVLDSCEYIGIVSLCSQLYSIPTAGYPAGEAKSYVPNAKLEKLGWLVTPQHPNRHKNDALRQLVKFLVVKLKVRHPITTAWSDNAD